MSKIVKYNEFKKVIDALWDKVKGTFVTEVNYDTNGSILKYVKNGSETEITKVVTEWKDLEYTTQSSLKNIFDKNAQVEDNKRYYYDHIQENQDWKIAKIPCQAGDEFTIIKNDRNDSSQIGLFEAGDIHIQSASATYQLVKGRMVYHLTIPNSVNNVSYFVTSMQKNITNVDEVMIFKENVADNDIPTKYIPFSGGAEVLINSENVALSFDNTGTNLTSSNIHSAIKELEAKVNTGGITNIEIDNVTGLRDELDNKVDNSRVGNEANKIPVIDGGGKLATSIIPNLAITDVFVVANETAMMQQNVQVGDVVVVENEGNKTYMCKDPLQPDKANRFITINMGTPMVMKVNNISPSSTGELVIKGNQIQVSNTITTSISEELEKCVRTVNGEPPRLNGEVTVNAGQISGVYGGHAGKIQDHFNTIKTSIDGNTTRIATLESRLPSHVVGEFMVCYGKGDRFTTKDGAVFLHLNGQLVQHRNYPDLASALGITTTVTSYEIPRINDITDNFDLGSKRAVRKHYVCAKA